jgi:hypothetical protein
MARAAVVLAVPLLFGCGGGGSPESTGQSSTFDLPAPPPISSAAQSEAVRGRVPAELVGAWDGDGTPSSPVDKITFFADGTVSLLYRGGATLDGPAVVESSQMTLYVPGGPILYRSWSIEEFDAGDGYVFENLMLDGVSYVRQIS